MESLDWLTTQPNRYLVTFSRPKSCKIYWASIKSKLLCSSLKSIQYEVEKIIHTDRCGTEIIDLIVGKRLTVRSIYDMILKSSLLSSHFKVDQFDLDLSIVLAQKQLYSYSRSHQQSKIDTSSWSIFSGFCYGYSMCDIEYYFKTRYLEYPQYEFEILPKVGHILCQSCTTKQVGEQEIEKFFKYNQLCPNIRQWVLIAHESCKCHNEIEMCYRTILKILKIEKRISSHSESITKEYIIKRLNKSSHKYCFSKNIQTLIHAIELDFN